MDIDFFKSIVDRVDFPTIIVPYSNGEPLLHPHVTEAMDYIINRKSLTTYLTTNGTIWNDDLFRMTLKDNKYYQTIFSLDGLSTPMSRSIELTRPGSDRSKILDTVHRYLDMKLHMNSKTDVAVKITERGQDWQEIEEFILYWLDVPGIDFVVMGHILLEQVEEGMRIYPCQYSDDVFMMIRADGTLTLCMYNEQIVNGGENPLGQLDKTTDLLKVYNNEAYTNFREDQRNGLFHGPCKTCGFAFTGYGFEGQIRSRNKCRYPHTIYTHRDYFNEFFSKRKKIRKRSFYGYPTEPHAHLTEYAQSEIQYEES